MSTKTKSSKRRRKRMLTDGDGEPEFQVAPMVDVLLVLMLFFMSITTTEILKKEKNLHLPDAKNAEKDKNTKNQLVLNISWDEQGKIPHYSYNGQSYDSPESLVGNIQAEVKKNPSVIVLIRADRNVEYSNISNVMKACGTAGIATVAFSAVTGGENQTIRTR